MPKGSGKFLEVMDNMFTNLNVAMASQVSICMLKLAKFYTLNILNLLCVNYTSTKLPFKKCQNS